MSNEPSLYASVQHTGKNFNAAVNIRFSGACNRQTYYKGASKGTIVIHERFKIPPCTTEEESVVGASPEAPWMKSKALVISIEGGKYQSLSMIDPPNPPGKEFKQVEASSKKAVWSVSGSLSIGRVNEPLYYWLRFSTRGPLIQASGEALKMIKSQCGEECDLSVNLEHKGSEEKSLSFASKIKKSDIRKYDDTHSNLLDAEIIINVALLTTAHVLLMVKDGFPQIYVESN